MLHFHGTLNKWHLKRKRERRNFKWEGGVPTVWHASDWHPSHWHASDYVTGVCSWHSSAQIIYKASCGEHSVLHRQQGNLTNVRDKVCQP